MTNNAKPKGYQGDIAEENKTQFPDAIQKAFGFMQANPTAYFDLKNHAALLQFDKKIARSVLQKLDKKCSLKEALALVLTQLSDDRDDEYVRIFVQWFISEFEASALEIKSLTE